MSKNDQRDVKNQTKSTIDTNIANSTGVNSQLQGILGTAQNTAGSILPGVTSGYSDISITGGYNPDVLGTINKTYGDLATTGGISAQDATAMQNRSAEAARSTYDVGAADAQRKLAATGGYGVSGSIVGDLSRKGSQAAATAVENTNASIAGIRQQGRIAGASGLSNTQNNMASNRLAGLAGSTNIYGMNENQVNTTVGQILQNYQQTGQLNNQDLAILTNLANQPGVYDKILQTIAVAEGAFKPR